METEGWSTPTGAATLHTTAPCPPPPLPAAGATRWSARRHPPHHSTLPTATAKLHTHIFGKLVSEIVRFSVIFRQFSLRDLSLCPEYVGVCTMALAFSEGV